MMGSSHAVLGIALTAGALQTLNPVLLGIAAAGSLLPDIDSSQSIAGRIFSPISSELQRRGVVHRTITHSWVAILIVCVLATPIWWLWSQAAYALVLGFCAGILGDMLTSNGVEFFWPSTARDVLIDHPRLRFATGSLNEFLVTVVITAAAVGIFNLVSAGGLIRAIGQWSGSPAAAIDFYNRNYAEFLIEADVSGWTSAARVPVNQQFRVLRLEGATFILQDPQGFLHRASQSDAGEILIDKIRTQRGKPVSTEIRTLQLNDQPILATLAKLPLSKEVYVSGELATDDPTELQFPKSTEWFWPVVATGTGVRLHAARLEQLQDLGNRYGTGTLTVMIVNGR